MGTIKIFADDERDQRENAGRTAAVSEVLKPISHIDKALFSSVANNSETKCSKQSIAFLRDLTSASNFDFFSPW